jgi:hypothetical protein
MTAVPAEERAVDLVLDEPEIDVQPELEDEPLVPIELLMLPGETPWQTLRRIANERERERLTEKYGPTWSRKLALVEEKLPRKS